MAVSSGSNSGPPAFRWEGPTVIFDNIAKLDDDLSEVHAEFALKLTLHRKPEEYHVLSAGKKSTIEDRRAFLARKS